MSSFVALGSQWIILAEHSHSNFALFVSLWCADFSLSLSLSLSSNDAVGGHQWEVQALSARIHAGACRWCSVPKKVFTFRAR
jgi:hypothetical protein